MRPRLVLNPFAAIPVIALALAAGSPGQTNVVAPLPAGVHAVWDLDRAQREATPTRERICINGLWRWQPASIDAQAVPDGRWGFFKVPGAWPGITDYMQKDCQTVFPYPTWKDERLGAVAAAWYQREISVPAGWAGRRIAVAAEYVNSVAVIFVDGARQGEIRFPGGAVDLSSACRPGSTHVLSVLVHALPLKGVLLSYTDTNTAREVKGRVARRGLCGDVFLVGTPAPARLGDVKVDPSVRRGEITFDVGVEFLAPGHRYVVRAEVRDGDRIVTTFTSPSFDAAGLAGGRVRFTHSWRPDALWDLHTPQNTFTARCSLIEDGGRVCDTQWDVRFGFREFWIEGRDFFLNGTRIGLSAVPLDNAQVGAALASYDGARESLRRLKDLGINFVYTHNYGCEPGSHLGFSEILRAADDVGMLVALSQPHFSHYDWKSANPELANGYAPHAEFYVRVAHNHPAVVAYAMNHNATGYSEDMNPDLIDGLRDPRDARAQVNAKLARRAEAIVRGLDPSRVVYHHSSGNLGAMHTINFYPNFVPVQELSDWFGHWATAGVKPVFLCEYGAPFSWDWTMYRGWYKGERAFGSAAVPWEFSIAEWNAQFLGDRAYQISPLEAANLRWEARQMAAGRVWHRWDYPREVGSRDFDERYPVFALYLSDNWPAYRTWGVSAISPWEYGHFWKLRPGVDKTRRELPVDWTRLQRPGFSADYVGAQYERMDLAFARDDWIPTPAAQALLRYNRPLLAYIAGKPAAFTSKDHIFHAGETVEKQVVIINNSRESVRADVTWTVGLARAENGNAQRTIAPGEQQRVPVRFTLPPATAPAEYAIDATVRFAGGETQTDSFRIHVAAPRSRAVIAARIALFDPKGETAALLARLGIRAEPVGASADLAGFDLLIVGKQALSPSGPAPDIGRVRDGLRVVVCEQTAEVLEKRFGFRIAEYGLRRVFARVPDHPALANITAEQLRDWRGEASLSAPRLQYETRPRYGPTVRWCDIPVTRLWRCGSRGNVASVVIEKPASGNFLSIVDGGFDLQYSALLECREGRGVILFCQIDVAGRTETEPVAETLFANLLGHAAAWQPTPAKRVIYIGEEAGRAHLERAGLSVDSYRGAALERDQVLVLGPGASGRAAPGKPALATWLQHGGRVVAVGLDQAEADTLLPLKIGMIEREHIAAFFAAPESASPLAGIGPADVMNRAPAPMPLIATGAVSAGGGTLGVAAEGNVVFCQLVPWKFDWQKQRNLKRTFRRSASLLTRVLANQGVAGASPIIERFARPVTPAGEQRWSRGLYLDQPEEWDDPYRFFRW